jgi:outer membrane PBP1 activator LpoA protein
MTLNWLFGTLFLFAGLALTFTASVGGGVCLACITLLLLPPVRDFVHTKTRKTMRPRTRAILILVLLMASSLFTGFDSHRQEAKVTAERVALAKQEKADYFRTHRDQIISDVTRDLKAGDFQAATSQAGKFLDMKDRDITDLYAQAQAQILMAELKTVPREKYRTNQRLYARLVDLCPNNQKYRDKLSYYTSKVDAEDEKRRAAALRSKQVENQFSSWDGSHKNLEGHIRSIMNDPDSYEHVKTVYWDRGDHLIVQTSFRGKNAFGGLVLNSIRAEVSMDGQVVAVLD